MKKLDFKPQAAIYNPRKLDKKTKARLKNSMAEFGDISGITINRRTGNILTGNHRWKQLEDTYGTLELIHKEEDKYSITKKGKYTGYYARIVDWDLNKEKQANIVANAATVQGDFTEDLQDMLSDISEEVDKSIMDDLGMLDMMLIGDDDAEKDLDMDETKTDLKRKKTVEDLIEDDDQKPEPVKEIISTIKITAPSEYKEEILEVVLRALSKKEYYDELVVS